MKILLDNNIPLGLRHLLSGHDVYTAVHQGWAALTNGKLLGAAESAELDLLVTRDHGFLNQHNMEGRSISVAVLVAEGQTRSTFVALIGVLSDRIGSFSAGTISTIKLET